MIDTPIDAIITFRTKTYNYIVQQLIPFTSVQLIINIQDSNDKNIVSSTLLLDGDAYAAWGNDDTYLDECVDTEVKRILGIE